MLKDLTILLVCQLIGEVIAKVFHLPVPGPVIGMAFLFAVLFVRRGVPDSLQRTCQGLLQHLSLLFVPAGVGVMLHLKLISREWLPITVAIILSTIITIAVTALIMKILAIKVKDSP